METRVGQDLAVALQYLMQGQTVAIPTETVYGLAADANNEDAVLSIFAAKNRPTSNPLILHFADLPQALPYINEFPLVFKVLYKEFCPGPLTFIVEKSSVVSSFITGGQQTVAIRFSAHPFLQKLLVKLDRPLAAPSANLYGQVSPTNASHVYQQLNGRIPYILDGGSCEHGLESTIIGLQDNKVVIFRHGGITAEALQTALGYTPETKNQEESGILTSGMVKYHYATQTPLYLGFKPIHEKDTAVQITIANNLEIEGPHLILSNTNLLEEAARNLYATLHHADGLGMQKIYIQPFIDSGLGKAMNDRLFRAAAKFAE